MLRCVVVVVVVEATADEGKVDEGLLLGVLIQDNLGNVSTYLDFDPSCGLGDADNS